MHANLMKHLSILFLLSCLSICLQAQTEKSHTCVDLGLSVKWATCNVGAEKPEAYGNYYAWAELTTKEEYTWLTYRHCNGSSTSLTKYCVGNAYGKVDNLVEMESCDDVATVEWGRRWRIPTDAEMTELREKCTWTWTSLNGVNGYEVVGKNGKSIFLPAAGSYQSAGLSYVGTQGLYCTTTSCKNYSFSAYELNFTSEVVERADISRRFGVSVRPVCK